MPRRPLITISPILPTGNSLTSGWLLGPESVYHSPSFVWPPPGTPPPSIARDLYVHGLEADPTEFVEFLSPCPDEGCRVCADPTYLIGVDTAAHILAAHRGRWASTVAERAEFIASGNRDVVLGVLDNPGFTAAEMNAVLRVPDVVNGGDYPFDQEHLLTIIGGHPQLPPGDVPRVVEMCGNDEILLRYIAEERRITDAMARTLACSFSRFVRQGILANPHVTAEVHVLAALHG